MRRNLPIVPSKPADENFNVDFSLYDWGNNGVVDEVFIIYVGDNMAEGGTGIWPHKSQTWNTDEGTYYNVDGKRIWVYACTSELNSSGNAAGIGTMCHEFSHCMGFPDLYDVDYKCIDPTTGDTFNGMGRWDLMCSGSYNGDGYQPAGYSGFEKWCARWQYPVALTEDEEFTNVKPMSENGDFYVMYNNGNKNEFYYLENRQQTGWDACSMAVVCSLCTLTIAVKTGRMRPTVKTALVRIISVWSLSVPTV